MASVKSKILNAAMELFLEKGYEKTTLRDIASKAQVNYGSLTFAFKSKEAIVSELVGHVLDYQFEVASELLQDKMKDKILFYAFETVLQLHIAESSEHLREMYNVSYSLPNSSQVVYSNITEKLQNIFSEHLPHLQTTDFYELEIASAGIMRNFISIPCNMYFTMEKKVKRFLETTFLVYRVNDEKIAQAIEFVSNYDFKSLAIQTINRMRSNIKDII